ncbi:MAG: hypothetical protein ACXWH0_09140 [Acidimicrobiia bacterium]
MAIDLPGTGEVVEIVDTRFGLMAVGIDDAGTTLWTSTNGITGIRNGIRRGTSPVPKSMR